MNVLRLIHGYNAERQRLPTDRLVLLRPAVRMPSPSQAHSHVGSGSYPPHLVGICWRMNSLTLSSNFAWRVQSAGRPYTRERSDNAGFSSRGTCGRFASGVREPMVASCNGPSTEPLCPRSNSKPSFATLNRIVGAGGDLNVRRVGNLE